MAALVKHLDKDGATVIAAKNWPDAFAGETQDPQKFGLENISNRVLGASPGGLELIIETVGTNDGSTQLRIKEDASGTLSAPYGVTTVLSGAGAGGVWGSTGVRGYRITALNGTGETIGSIEKTINVDNTTKKVTVSWTAIVGATSYKVYRTDTAGVYTSPALRATTVAATFTDDGSAVGAGAPPSTNTTGGAGPDYGTPPAGLNTSLGPVAVGSDFAIGRQFFYWVNRVIQAGTTEEGNPRAALVTAKET